MIDLSSSTVLTCHLSQVLVAAADMIKAEDAENTAPSTTQCNNFKADSTLLQTPVHFRDAAPSITSVNTASSRPLLPVLPSAPSVPSVAYVAVSPQPSVQSHSPSKPSNAVEVSSNCMFPVRPKPATIAVPAQAPSHCQPIRHSVIPDVTANITMATKDAFACVNAMFGSSLVHAPNATRNLAAMAEPTVTISTKAAFEELNSMFSSDLPHHSKQLKHGQRNVGSRQSDHMSAATVAKQMHQHMQASQAKGGLVLPAIAAEHSMRSNTQSITAAKHASHQDAALAIYEDTNFLPSQPNLQPTADQTAGFAIYEDTGCLDKQPQQIQEQRGPSADATQGFQVYEDTQCLQAKPSLPVSSPVFGVREDTGCLQKPHRLLPTVNKGSPASFAIYEDTECLQKPHSKGLNAAQGSPGSLAIHEDTQYVNSPIQIPSKQSLQPTALAQTRQHNTGSHSPAGFGVYEDTQFVKDALPSSKPAVAKTQKQRPSAVKDAENAVLVEDKENCRRAPRYSAHYLLLAHTAYNS